MQVVRLRGGPALKCRCITPNGSKPAVVEPVQHSFFLLHARPPLLLVRTNLMGTQGHLIAVLRSTGVIGFDEAAADETDGTWLDVAALRGRANVDALGLSTGGEISIRDCVIGVWVVRDVVGAGVAAVVEEQAFPGQTMLSPVVNAAFVVGVWSDYIAAFCLKGIR